MNRCEASAKFPWCRLQPRGDLGLIGAEQQQQVLDLGRVAHCVRHHGDVPAECRFDPRLEVRDQARDQSGDSGGQTVGGRDGVTDVVEMA